MRLIHGESRPRGHSSPPAGPPFFEEARRIFEEYPTPRPNGTMWCGHIADDVVDRYVEILDEAVMDTAWNEHSAMIGEAVQIKHNWELELIRSRGRVGPAFPLQSKVPGWPIDRGTEPISGVSPQTDGIGPGNPPP